jgi:4-carboxymuconolactone decarboxylase
MPRVPYYDLAKAPPEYLQRIEGLPVLNLFRMLPWSGAIATQFLRMGGAILARTGLDARLRELAILRVGALTGSDYEVHHHRRICRDVGLTGAQMDATATGAGAAVLDQTQRLVIAFTDAVLKEVKAPDALFAEILEALGPEALAELVMTIGYYRLVAGFLLNFGVEIEAEPVTEPIVVTRS